MQANLIRSPLLFPHDPDRAWPRTTGWSCNQALSAVYFSAPKPPTLPAYCALSAPSAVGFQWAVQMDKSLWQNRLASDRRSWYKAVLWPESPLHARPVRSIPCSLNEPFPHRNKSVKSSPDFPLTPSARSGGTGCHFSQKYDVKSRLCRPEWSPFSENKRPLTWKSPVLSTPGYPDSSQVPGPERAPHRRSPALPQVPWKPVLPSLYK